MRGIVRLAGDPDPAPQFVAAICPPRHHTYAFIPIVGAGIGAADAVIIDMRELALDGVGGGRFRSASMTPPSGNHDR
jgi:hypothetical protein